MAISKPSKETHLACRNKISRAETAALKELAGWLDAAHAFQCLEQGFLLLQLASRSMAEPSRGGGSSSLENRPLTRPVQWVQHPASNQRQETTPSSSPQFLLPLFPSCIPLSSSPLFLPPHLLLLLLCEPANCACLRWVGRDAGRRPWCRRLL